MELKTIIDATKRPKDRLLNSVLAVWVQVVSGTYATLDASRHSVKLSWDPLQTTKSKCLKDYPKGA